MARLPRLTLTGYPHHVMLRGTGCQAIFKSSADFEYLLSLIAHYAAQEKVDVHGYVLMSDHIHLLLTPREEKGLPRFMQALGRAYVRRFNQVHERFGSLWEGRYRAALIQSERYLLACMVYLDLNPVRAGLVLTADAYAWSSHAHYIGKRQDKFMTPHALYWTLGNTPFAREAAYAELVRTGISVDQQGALTNASLGGWALGDEHFVADLQSQTERRLVKNKAGRPFKPVPN